MAALWASFARAAAAHAARGEKGAALTYFGIFFAVPLRRQTILVEKLTFPSGTATAKLIDLLHSGADERSFSPSSSHTSS